MEKWVEKIAAEITIDSLPEPYKEMAGIVGVDNAIKLSKYLGGLQFYFPELEGILIERRNEIIRQEFTGFNHRKLARKYGLTEVWIRKIVQIKADSARTQQTNLLDMLSKENL